MTTITKALLLNVGIFEAVNNLRRYKGSHSLNYSNEVSNLSKIEVVLVPGASFVWRPSVVPAVTIARVLGCPVTATVTLGPVAGVRTDPASILTVINQFMVLDDNVSLITFVNQGTSNSAIVITQG